MAKYAAETDVPIERSQAEIKGIIMRYGATRYATLDDPNCAMILFEIENRRIRFTLPLPDKSAEEFTHKNHNSGKRVPRSQEDAYRFWEQACRQRWRALCLIIKAKLEAVETGITTIEREFLNNIMLPDGQTVGDFILPQIEASYSTGKMPPLLPGIGETTGVS
jgi:hypothetical protein